jgi:hypothetical protein
VTTNQVNKKELPAGALMTTIAFSTTNSIVRLSAILTILLAISISSCGSKSSSSNDVSCPTSSSSSTGRVDPNTGCPIYGDSAWTDAKLLDSDTECQAFMSATDAPAQPRLIAFCRCITDKTAANVDLQTYTTDPGGTIMASYKAYGQACSTKAEYAVPSSSAGTLYANVDYTKFMKDCSASGSTRNACRCLIMEDSKVLVSSFATSPDSAIHSCGVVKTATLMEELNSENEQQQD